MSPPPKTTPKTTPARDLSVRSSESLLDRRPGLRLLVGLGRLGVDWLRYAAATAGERTGPSPPRGIGRRVVLGTIAALPAWRDAARESRPAHLARRATALIGATGPGRRMLGRMAAARGRARLLIARLVLRGEQEERRGRELAQAALTEMFDETCERLADSEALRRLVREQTTGLGEAAIARMRAWCASADDALEASVGRVLGTLRRRRSPRGGLLPAEAAR